MARDTELELIELEGKILEMANTAYDAWESSGAEMPPPVLVTLVEKAHKMLCGRMKDKRTCGSYDLNNPEATLLQLKSVERMLLAQIGKRQRLLSIEVS